MDFRAGDSESRFVAYVEGLASVIGHADRAAPLHDYCMGLLLPGERKSVEPMAARTAPARTSAQHQSLLHFVGVAAWSDEKVLAKVHEMVRPQIERHGPRRGGIRLVLGANTAARSASRRTARLRCHCRLPIITPACRLLIGCICRRTGRRMANVATRPVFPQTFAL